MNIYINTIRKVKSTKFVGVVIDDQLTWRLEPQVEYLKAELISSIVTIERIKPFIPKTEYEKVYNALLISHLFYCISCWGGIPNYKLGKMFSIQKRCLVQTDPSEKIDSPTQRAFQGFLTFLSSIRCPLRLTNFSKLFHVG